MVTQVRPGTGGLYLTKEGPAALADGRASVRLALVPTTPIELAAPLGAQSTGPV